MFQITAGLLAAFLFSHKAFAFVYSLRSEVFKGRILRRSSSCCSLVTPKDLPISIEDLKLKIEEEIKTTKRGLSASPEKRTRIDSLVQSLESLCPYKEPARMPEMAGKWIVDYTTAPPPSNGKLGPFKGVARQIIDLDDMTYINYLSVPGDIGKEFLSAELEATFEEWDGEFLKDDRITADDNDADDFLAGTVPNESPASTDWLKYRSSIFEKEQRENKETKTDCGANCWKVDFKTLTIKLFGFRVFGTSFDDGTSRVWKMSYLDKDGTRVVRAGRTGKDEDSLLFYMQRE